MRRALWPLVAFLLAGCAMEAAQHRASMEQVYTVAYHQGIEAAIGQLERQVMAPDPKGRRALRPNAPIIALLELGALYHYAGRYRESNQVLEVVY
ncbi:MAG: hypothetical protein D6819_05060, partial [Gammaproteobacteria bacterium]